MSLWRRLLGIDEAPERRRQEVSAPRPVSVAPPAEPTPEERLRELADEATIPVSDGDVLALVDELAASAREARALALGRRVLGRHPDLDGLALGLADRLWARGDADGAEELLERVLDTSRPPLAALMLQGEIAERRGRDEEALAAYERILARNLDYPRAKERVRRLRDLREPRRDLAGATLMTDGALARGRYRVERELGRGGAGTVFAATDTNLGRRVALKMYHRRGRWERERLRVEGRTAAFLEHPGVIRIFDVEEELAAIAMEWIRGGSIRAELKKGPVPLARVRRWFVTALEGLAYIHARGVVHRDLKPSNLLLRERDDRVVLTDFGLAARHGEHGPGRQGLGEGTLAYMAPEQRAGVPAEPAADVHAFGASMREILGQTTGEVPPAWLELAKACTRTTPEDRPSVEDLQATLTTS